MSDTAFYNRIRAAYKDRDDELIAAAAKIRETMDTPGWELLWDYIGDAEQKALARLLQSHSTGKVMEQAEYASVVSYLAGIKEPQTVAQAFQQAAENVHIESPE